MRVIDLIKSHKKRGGVMRRQDVHANKRGMRIGGALAVAHIEDGLEHTLFAEVFDRRHTDLAYLLLTEL